MPKRTCMDMMSPFSFDGRFWIGEIEYKYRRLLTWNNNVDDGAATLNTASYTQQVIVNCTVHYVTGALTSSSLATLIDSMPQPAATYDQHMNID